MRLHSSSIFLLDDPYSALDAHVAKSVNERAILGQVISRDFKLFQESSDLCSLPVSTTTAKATPSRKEALIYCIPMTSFSLDLLVNFCLLLETISEIAPSASFVVDGHKNKNNSQISRYIIHRNDDL